jgi:hypothetical protein
VNYRTLVTSLILTLMAAGCDVGVPTKQEVADLEKGSAPAEPAAPPLPAEVNTLPPSHPPTEGMAAPAGMPTGHPPVGASSEPAVEAGSIPVAEGGVTIEGLFAKKAELVGQEVTVRGKVVKATAGVMGTNWYHLQDGTGAAGSNDLTVTSDATAKVGDVVVIAGTVATDKDFGMGYKYDVIVEKATLTAE